MSDSEIRYGNWCKVYPCEDGCGNILPPSAFDNGRIYRPCQKCGGKIYSSKVARRKFKIQEVEERYFFNLFERTRKVKIFLDWEMRGSEANG